MMIDGEDSFEGLRADLNVHLRAGWHIGVGDGLLIDDVKLAPVLRRPGDLAERAPGQLQQSLGCRQGLAIELWHRAVSQG